uniref:Uncharacterized protein n=1 Tax=Toxoplasma gondii (strain ATCC 50861 / VEG) TaxID=432359 RepID=A0A0F7UTE4_TOXGV|nr:TPA: hypothetical protein BN1205_091930 [Toxoplasma gondii VEG]
MQLVNEKMGRAIHWGGNFSWLPFAWQTECRRTRGFGDFCGAYCCLTKFLMFPEVAILPTEKLDRSSSCMETQFLTTVFAPSFPRLRCDALTRWKMLLRSHFHRKTPVRSGESFRVTIRSFSAFP